MGDEALKVTERQFTDLVRMSAGDIDVQFRLFALERTPRSPRALEYISARYDPASAAMEGDLDALIITGAQPRTARLSEEPYWEELIDLIDWAKEHTASTILSCLAAHSAVLHLDGLGTSAVAREMHRRFPLQDSARIIRLRLGKSVPVSFRTLDITACRGATLSAPAMKS